MTKGRVGALLAGSLLVGLTLRVNGLGLRGLGTDEGIYAWIASLPLEMLPRFLARDSAAPLYFVILKPWQALFESDAGVRALSIILGTVSVGLAFLIGRALCGAGCGAAASCFMAAAPFHVLYSQQAKNVVLFVLAVQAAFLALLAAARGPFRWRRWALLGLALAALLLTHGLAPLYVIALAPAFFLLADRPLGSRVKGWIAAHVIAGALVLPWAGVAVSQTSHVLTTFWAPRPGVFTPLRTLSNLLLMREARPDLSVASLPGVGAAAASPTGCAALADRIVFEAWAVPALIAALAGAWILGATGRVRILLALASLFVAPVAGAWIVSRLAASVYLDRALMPSLIPIIILMAIPIAALGWRKQGGDLSVDAPAGRSDLHSSPPPTRNVPEEGAATVSESHRPTEEPPPDEGSDPRSPWIRAAALAAAAALVIAVAISAGFMRRFVDPQWREAMAWLDENAEDGDAVVFDAHFGRILFDRYLGGRTERFGLYGLPSDLHSDEVPTMHKVVRSEADVAPLEEAASKHRTIWLVLSHTEVHDPEGLAYQWCDAHLTKTDRKVFVGVVLVRYASPS